MMKNEALTQIRSILADVPNNTFLVESACSDETHTFPKEPIFQFPATGKGKMELYPIFPGIFLSRNIFLADQMTVHLPSTFRFLRIVHCRTGKMEWTSQNGALSSLVDGELSLYTPDSCKEETIVFPFGYFEGISLLIQPEASVCSPPPLFQDNARYPDCLETLCKRSENAVVFPSLPEIDCIFRPLYDLSSDLRIPYFRLKTQELFLYFYRFAFASSEARFGLSRQTALMQQIHQKLTENLEQRYTIDELSRQYLINTSSLKEMFKKVYGMPIASYMKEYRIRKAMELLLHTDNTIAEIASKVGYETQGKFTKAFKEYTHRTPSHYRKIYRSENPLFFHLD